MTTEKMLLAVDAGTSIVKTVAFDTAGAEVAKATRDVETHRPTAGHVEQDMSAVWERAAETLREVTAEVPDGAGPVGVSVTGQGDGLWPVDADGEPVRNAVLWSDSRAAGVLEEWDENGQLAEIVERCGSAPYPGMSLPLLAWLAREEPDQFELVDTILSCKDWLKYKLTGEPSLDPSEATVPYLDRTTERYDRSVFELVGLSEARDTLPPLVSPTEVVGQVTTEAASATGLDAGLPVVSGTFDVPASAIGSGAATAGGTTVTLGTSLTHQVFVDGPQSTSSGIQMALGLDELWTYAIGSNAGTPSLEWVADAVANGRSFDELESLAADAPPGSGGVVYHPYLSTTGERGPFVDPNARGQFVGLTPEHDTAHLVRAVYEGLSLAVRDCVEHLPADVTAVRLTGGGTRSAFWCQLLADCLDCTVSVPAGSEPGAKGAAILLALATDEYPSLSAASEQMVTVDRRFEPRDDVASQYAELYDLFAAIRTEMQSVWSRRAQTYDT